MAVVARYAPTTTGHFAGLVEVRCHAQPDGTTRATVTYELPAPDDDARHTLGELARGYADSIAERKQLIAAALEAGRIPA